MSRIVMRILYFWYIKSAISVFFTYLYSKWNRRISYENRKCYDLMYYWHGQLYRVRILKPRITDPNQSRTIFDIKDQDENSILDKILPYMGPKHNFHGIHYCPIDFGYSSMSFYWTDGSCQVFKMKDKITYEEN